MKLMTKQLERRFMAIGKTFRDSKGRCLIPTRYVCVANGWTFYPWRYNPRYKSFYGFMCFKRRHWGQVLLKDLEQVNAIFNFPIIQRDMEFHEKALSEENMLRMPEAEDAQIPKAWRPQIKDYLNSIQGQWHSLHVELANAQAEDLDLDLPPLDFVQTKPVLSITGMRS